jgi:hypothetical protein
MNPLMNHNSSLQELPKFNGSHSTSQQRRALQACVILLAAIWDFDTALRV